MMDRNGASEATSKATRCVRRSSARSGGTTTSMTTATVPEAGTSDIGPAPRSGWVAAASVSPSSRSRVSPSGTMTSTVVRVTGARKALVTRRSYSRWSTPSLPATRSGSFVAATRMAVVGATPAGEAAGVAWLATPAPGTAATGPASIASAVSAISRSLTSRTPSDEPKAETGPGAPLSRYRAPEPARARGTQRNEARNPGAAAYVSCRRNWSMTTATRSTRPRRSSDKRTIRRSGSARCRASP